MNYLFYIFLVKLILYLIQLIPCQFYLFDDERVSKIIELSINAIRLFGNATILSSIELFSEEADEMVTLISPNYPKVLVNTRLKNELALMLKNPKQTSTSVFRKLIGNIIIDSREWAIRNGKKMIEDFEQEIYAAFGKASYLNFNINEMCFL